MQRWITGLTQKIERQASESRLVFGLASQYYRDVIEKEIVLARITEHDHILCIGGGVCPFSAILFHQSTGAKVTVIDSDETCIPKAQQVIDRLGLGGHIRVFCQDGGSAELSFAEYSIVHFALQVSPMERVFSHAEKHAVPGTRLLVRMPKNHLSNLYSPLSACMMARCPYVAHKKARNIDSTLLYIKREQSHEEKVVICGVADSTASFCPVAA